jgi:hypothetical protein
MATLDPGTTGRRPPGAVRKTARHKKKKTVKPAAATEKEATETEKTAEAATEKARKEATEKEKAKAKRRTTLDPPAGSLLMTIPATGKKYFGLSKNGSYDAAERGDFGPLYEVGRRKYVVVPALEAKILKDVSAAKAAE